MRQKTKKISDKILKIIKEPCPDGLRWTIKKLAKKVKCDFEVVKNILRHNGITTKQYSHGQSLKDGMISKEKLEAFLKTNPPEGRRRWTLALIGDYFGCTKEWIRQLLIKYGIGRYKILGVGQSLIRLKCQAKDCKYYALKDKLYCQIHQVRFDKFGSTEPQYPYANPPKCKACDRLAIGHGYCLKHLHHIEKWGEVRRDKEMAPRKLTSQADKRCSVKGCNRTCYCKDKCRMHYYRERKQNGKRS